MNNGQLNITSMQTMTQLVTNKPTVPVAVKMADDTHDDGDFAGLLSGTKLPVKEQDLPDSGRGEQLLIRVIKDHFALDAAAEDPEKTDDSADGAPLSSDPSDVALQMVLAAYSQPGRMPEVNIPTPLPVDTLQKVDSAVEQPAVNAASPVETQGKQVAAEPLPTASVQQAEKLTICAEEPQQCRQSEAVLLSSTTGRQPPETVEAHPVVSVLPATGQPAVVAPSVPTNSTQEELSDRMSDVNKPTSLPVDSRQKAAAVTDQPAAVQVQAPIALSAISITVPVPDEPITLLETRTADLATIPAEKAAATSKMPQSEPQSDHQVTPEPVLSLESELEIHLSQPRPITARMSAAPVLADNRSAASVQELRVARQRLNPEQQIDKVRAGNEQSNVKEMASSLQAVTPTGGSSLGSETSRGSDNNQEQPDVASDNQLLTQDMRGQLKTEHQRDSALSAKAVPTEPVRQNVSEQVMLQVKDRLVQHEVKPGSQQITLTLSPENLGELKMNLNLQGQKLSIEIVTENRTVRDAIVQHTEALKESLARQNITMESFDVTTGGKGSGNQGQNQNAWRELAKQQQQQQLWTAPRGSQSAQADVSSVKGAYQRQQGQTMLDIHY